MKYGDTDQPAGMPVTTPDGSRRNLQEHGDGVSRLSARTKNFYPQTKQMMEAVVERKAAGLFAFSSMYYVNRRGTEPYARWCGRTAGAIPPPTRFILHIIRCRYASDDKKLLDQSTSQSEAHEPPQNGHIFLRKSIQPSYNSTIRYLEIRKNSNSISIVTIVLYKNHKNCERFQ